MQKMYFDLKTKSTKTKRAKIKKTAQKKKASEKQKPNKKKAQHKTKPCTSTLNAAFNLGIICEIIALFMLVVQCMTTQSMLFGWNLP